MPSADTADSVASMARNHQGPSTLAGAEPWSMLERSRKDKMGGKDKQSAGKGVDKGKLSPRRMVLPGAASATGFTGIHRQCPQAEVVQYRGRFRQWEVLVGT